jgi:hypothetical protein
MRHESTSRGRAHEHSGNSELLPAWSVSKKERLQEEQVLQEPEEQP